MKAVSYSKYGGPQVLMVTEIAKPAPAEHEILIKIKSTAVNSADRRMRAADPMGVRLFFGLIKPKRNILGGVLSGIVEEVGTGVTRFKAGDEVFGTTGMGFGAYAEYRCLPEKGSLTLKPKNLSHQEAAVIPFGGTTALYFLKKAGIRPGQKVLIVGASGAVGTAAVQLAKHYGAQVTAVCSGANAGLVRALGADLIIDYTREDFTRNEGIYDVVFDTVGKVPVARLMKPLSKKGILVLGATGLAGMFHGLWISMSSARKVVMGVSAETAEDIAFLKELAEAGRIRPVIDRTYSLDQIAEAHEYIDRGHKKGNVSITVG